MGQKITQYTRYATVILALVQSFGIATMLYKQPGLVVDSEFHFFATAIVCLVTGTMFLMWLGEQITERGLGNGASMIITTGIISGMPSAIGKTLSLANQGFNVNFLGNFSICYHWCGNLYCGICRARNAKFQLIMLRQVGNKSDARAKYALPLKLNMAGVIPQFLLQVLFYSLLLYLDGLGMVNYRFGFYWRYLASRSTDLYSCLCCRNHFLLLLYTALTFNPKDTADNLKKSGAFIPAFVPVKIQQNTLKSSFTLNIRWRNLYRCNLFVP